MEMVNPTQSKVEALPLLGTTLVCIASRKTPFLFSLHSLIYVPELQAFSPPSLWELKLKCETRPAGVRGFLPAPLRKAALAVDFSCGVSHAPGSSAPCLV